MTIPVIIHGAGGRMGQRLVALTIEDPALSLVGAVEHASHAALGQDAGVLAQAGASGVLLSHPLEPKAGQVVVDFSLPVALPGVIEACVNASAALVCGTTGVSASDKEALAEAGKTIPVLYSPNMSVGVNLMFLAARQMAAWAGESFDLEIVESHHRFKKDAPSGTALRLGEMLAEGRGWQLNDVARYTREGIDEARKDEEIGIQTLRGGDIVGEHTAYFCTAGERLELTHRATSRDIFVRGALRAASWLHSQPSGFYSMFDVLSF